MNDDHMDDLIIQAARNYNRPGTVPRDEMWTAIAAARRQAPAVASIHHRRIWAWPSIGIAAAALIAVGVTIGRRVERDSAAVPTRAATPVVAPVVAQAPSKQPDTLIGALRTETRHTDQRVRELASADAGSVPTQQSLAYRLVVLRHLAGSEALITSFRSSARKGEPDAQIAQWSRELLGTTRLLEASDAADDPMMKRLLEDLDLVIAQIAQYASRGTYNAEELDLIEQSIKQRGVMTKLRSTVPAPAALAHM